MTESTCRYMTLLPSGEWEYGHQDMLTHKKTSHGVTTSPEEAMLRNSMTPTKGTLCSGKRYQPLYAHLPPYSVLSRR
jgi:hypothetical protein